MPPFVHEKLPALQQLCHDHEVQRLELFGSAAKDQFQAEKSDLDFLVLFQPDGAVRPAKRYFGLLLGLEDLFHRSIDLVELGAIKNPYFLRGIGQSRIVLYDARGEKVPV